MKNTRYFNLLFILLGALIVVFIVFPVLKIIFSSKPEIVLDTILDREVLNSIILTIKVSFLTTIFGVIFGVPIAYILARYNFYGKSIIEGAIDLPVIIPHSAAGIALLNVFGRKFFFGHIFNSIGIRFVGTEWGIGVAMAFVSVPFLINGAKEGFKLIDPRYENVAMTLGAKKSRAFFDITLPLASKSILSGVIMMWARGISEFGAVLILTYHPMVTSIVIFERFESYGLKYARPVSALLILICLMVFIILRFLMKKKKLYDQTR